MSRSSCCLAKFHAERLISLIHSKSGGTEALDVRDDVRLVLYFDESHILMDEPFASADLKEDARSGYQILCSVMNYFRRLSLCCIYLSTNSSLSKFSPSKRYWWSARTRQGKDDPVQAPFVELPFDVWNNNILAKEGTHTLEEVCETKFMVRFGRPL